MPGHLSLVLLGRLVSRTVFATGLEPVRVGRYSAIVPGPLPSKPILLRSRSTLSSPYPCRRSVTRSNGPSHPAATGLQALHASCPSLSALLALPLPAVHRTLGPMRLDEALGALAGPAHTVVVDPVHRLVSFELRQRYASLAPMATPRAPVDARKAQAPAGRAAGCTRRNRFLPRPQAAGGSARSGRMPSSGRLPQTCGILAWHDRAAHRRAR